MKLGGYLRLAEKKTHIFTHTAGFYFLKTCSILVHVTPTKATESLYDIQKTMDERHIPIHQVGVRQLKYPIEILDRSGRPLPTVATISMTVNLPADQKGTHMSRFVEVLNAHGRLIQTSSLPEILRALQIKLQSDSAHLVMEFPYFVEKKAPVTGIPAFVDYQVKFEADLFGKDFDFRLTTTVPVTTLCPCSKAISDRGAHNQRGYVTLTTRSNEIVWIEELIDLIEQSASAQIYSLLKRPDEKFVTEQAYDNPVFVEDLVRNIAQRCNEDSKILWYRVEAENMESIHNHTAYAMIENGQVPE